MTLVVGMFDAAPGADYFAQIADIFMRAGGDLAQTGGALGGTAAFGTVFPQWQTNDQFAAKFLSPFGLESNVVAVDFVRAGLAAGMSKAQVQCAGLQALASTTDPQFAAAQATLKHKAQVAEYFSVTKAQAAAGLDRLHTVIETVTADPSTVLAAMARIDRDAMQASTPVDLAPADPDDSAPAPQEASFFRVVETGGVVTFEATAAGPITLTISAGTATFTKGAVTALATVAGIATKTISLGLGHELRISAANATALAGATITGAGDVSATASLSIAQLSGLAFNSFVGRFDYAVADTAAHLVADAAFVTGAVPVTITTAVSLGDLATIKGKTSGGVAAAAGIADSAGNLLAAGQGHPDITAAADVSVAGGAAGALTVVDVAALKGITTADSWSYSIVDTAAHLLSAGAGHASLAGAAAVAVTGDAAGAMSLADAAALKAITTNDTWSYAVSDSASNLLGAGAGDPLVAGAATVEVSGGSAGALSLAQVAALKGITTVDNWTYAVEDTALHLLAAGTNDAGILGANAVTVAGAAGGTLAIAQVATLQGMTTIDTWTYEVNDTLANLTDAANAGIVSGHDSIVSDMAGLAELAAIDAANGSGTVHASSITGSAAALLADTTYVSGSVNVTISGAVSIAQLEAIVLKTSGTVTAGGGIADASANLLGNLSLVAGNDVTITDSIDAAGLQAIYEQTSGVLTLTDVTDNDGGMSAVLDLLFPADPGLADADGYSLRFNWNGEPDPDGYKMLDGAFHWVGTASEGIFSSVFYNTNGSVTAPVVSGVAFVLKQMAATPGEMDGVTNLVVEGATDLAALQLLTGAVPGSVTYSEVYDLDNNLAADGGAFIRGDVNVTVGKLVLGSLAPGESTIARLDQYASQTTGTISYSGVIGTAADLVADATWVPSTSRVIVTDAVSYSQLATLGSKTVLYQDMVDTAANFKLNPGSWLYGSVNAQVSDAGIVVSDFNAIRVLTSGTISYHLDDTGAHIATALGGGQSFGSALDIVHTDAQLASLMGTDGVTDTFDYSAAGTNSISHFEHGRDRIDLSAFVAASDVAFQPAAADGTLVDIDVADAGPDLAIAVDLDDDGVADFVITLAGQGGTTVSAADFIFGPAH